MGIRYNSGLITLLLLLLLPSSRAPSPRLFRPAACNGVPLAGPLNLLPPCPASFHRSTPGLPNPFRGGTTQLRLVFNGPVDITGGLKLGGLVSVGGVGAHGGGLGSGSELAGSPSSSSSSSNCSVSLGECSRVPTR